MSMISAQIDELREKAEELRAHGTFTGFGGLTSTDPLMLKSVTLMREAADTIWELRDMVHKERAEADRLRDLVRDMVLNMGGCALHGNPLRLREFINRARELGIEVDDG